MQMIKIKLFDTNITFTDYPRQDVDQPAFGKNIAINNILSLPKTELYIFG